MSTRSVSAALLHVHLEPRHPRFVRFEFGHNIIGIGAAALPAAAVHHGLAGLDEGRIGKYQGVVVYSYGAAAEPALAFDIEILQLLGGGIPKVNRLTHGVG